LNKIDKNWDLFEHKTKIRTYLKNLNENWDQKCILTYNINYKLCESLGNFVLRESQCFK